MSHASPLSRFAESGRTAVQAERQLVVFQLAGETYGVDISGVREIIAMQTVTRLPGAPGFVEGVINLRGHVIPVLDLRKRFGLRAEVDPRHTRIMVVEIEPHTLGLVVDAVTEVLRVPEPSIEPATNVLTGIDVAFIEGVAKLENRLIILLNLERLLAASEVKSLERVRATIDAAEAAGSDAGAGGQDEGGRASAEVSPGERDHGADPVPA